MTDIMAGDALAVKILGNQKIKADRMYRPASYCLAEKSAGGILLLNNLTKRLVLISDEEIKRAQGGTLTSFAEDTGSGKYGSVTSEAESVSGTEADAELNKAESCRLADVRVSGEFLKDRAGESLARKMAEGWFLTPEDADDMETALQLRSIVSELRGREKSIVSYTVFTTMECNARCFYCFERGRKRTRMSLKTAGETAKFIADRHGSGAVQLRWFGGEPLMNMQAIDTICERLTDACVKYRSTMTSNGYLFDEAIVKKAKDLWKLGKVQITLDGTHDIYNRSKAYVGASEDPYLRVMRSIGLLLDAEIRVSVRLNLSRDNFDDLMLLVNELAERFGDGRKGLTIYASMLLSQEPEVGGAFDEHGWHVDESTYTRRREELMTLHAAIAGHGLKGVGFLEKRVKTNGCMADNDRAVTVLPDGRIGRCEHFSESEIMGDIRDGNFDEAVRAAWKERLKAGEICRECAAFPDCVQLKKCPGARICSPAEKKERERRLRDGMRREARAAEQRDIKE